MGEDIKVYGVWYRPESGEGGWITDTTGRFITSLSKGEMVAIARKWQRENDRQRYAAAAFGDDGFPEVLEKAASA